MESHLRFQENVNRCVHTHCTFKGKLLDKTGIMQKLCHGN